MNRVLFILLLGSSVALAQDVDLPIPKQKATPVPIVTTRPEEPTPTPTPIPNILVTPPPIQQAVVPTLVPLPLPSLSLTTVKATPTPISVRLFKVGSFPAGPRIKPAQVQTQGRIGSWLIGKFIILSQEDDHNYTCLSHVDSIGIGIVDIANHIGGGSPVILKLYVVVPPLGGMPREFSYGPESPLRITRISGSGPKIEVGAEDLTSR